MKKLKIWYFPLFVMAVALLITSSCEKDDEPVEPESYTFDTFTDSRDNKVYNVIKIGDQTWFAENLAYEIPGKKIIGNLDWANNAAFDGWCYYDNDKTTNGNTYGVLYQWEAAKSACPPGWHLPTDAEWAILSDYLGGENECGGKLKSTTHWQSPNTGATNETRFTGLPGGTRVNYGAYDHIGTHGMWWTSTKALSTNAHTRELVSNSSFLYQDNSNKLNGLSVRCLKD